LIDEAYLKRVVGVVLQDGDLWAIDPGQPPVKITGPDASDEFRNLRNASLIMYSTLTNAEEWFEKLLIWLEACNAEVAVDSVLKLQAAVRVSRRCAIEGLENLASGKKDS
jgi:hypothetical protein